VFEVCGNVRIIEQVAEITRIGTLTNLTNVYATLYDGTNTVNLTADGADLSSATVGTMFTKDKAAAQTYSVYTADECRCSEVLADKRMGLPFSVTAKNGSTTYMRFHYTTTDNPVDFDMFIKFVWEPLDGGCLILQ
jgi:hypothetical protein